MDVKFKPMLAASASNEEIEKIQYPKLASPKLDGIRAIVIDKVVYSRSMKPIRNKAVQEMFGNHFYHGFDGELVLGDPTDPKCFNNSTALMGENLREDVKHLPITFYVFDICPVREPFEKMEASRRHDNLLDFVDCHKPQNLKIVPQVLVFNDAQMREFEQQCLEEGYEGIMLKDPTGLYKQGRSTLKQGLLTKVKRFSDSEAVVIGFEEKLKNIAEREISELGYSKTTKKKDDFIPTDTLGALKVRDLETGMEFSIGSGFDDAQRKSIWEHKDTLLGKIVKYKHFSVGALEAPRFPTYLGFRDADDL